MQSRTSSTIEEQDAARPMDLLHLNQPSTTASPPTRLLPLSYSPNHEIHPDRIRFQDTEGESSTGGFASVRRALLDPPLALTLPAEPGAPQVVAVKILRASESLEAERLRKRLTREVLVLSLVKHPNVLELLGFHLDLAKKTAWIITPWATRGAVPSYLKKEVDIDLQRKLDLLEGVTTGLAHLHAQTPPICHADIKADNVLVTDVCESIAGVSGNGARVRAVLADVGLARLTDHEDFQKCATSTMDLHGSVRWCSPEWFEIGQRCIEGDVWSWAWLVWELITGTKPFPDILDDIRVIYFFARQAGPSLPDITQHPSFAALPELQRIMQRCWTLNPQVRAKIEECLTAVKVEITTLSPPDAHTFPRRPQRPFESPFTTGQQTLNDSLDPFDLTGTISCTE